MRSSASKSTKKPRKPRAKRTAVLSAKVREILTRTGNERALRDAIIASAAPMLDIDTLPVIELGPRRPQTRGTRYGGEGSDDE